MLQEQTEELARASSDQKSKVVGGWSFGLTGLKRAS